MFKVLIVDGEYGIRNLLSEILEDEGYLVSTAEDGNNAKRLVQVQAFDLILLDIWMPDMDGVSLLKEWSTSHAVNCPIVMMSGHGTIETAMEATRYGAADFLEKPISMQRLLETCRSVITKWEHEKKIRARATARSAAVAATASLNSQPAVWPDEVKPITVTLANVSEQAKACDHFIVEQLPHQTGPNARLPIIEIPDLHFVINYNLRIRELRDNLERAYFKRVFTFYGGSMTQLAKHSGLERTHLYRKLHMLGLDLNNKKGPEAKNKRADKDEGLLKNSTDEL